MKTARSVSFIAYFTLGLSFCIAGCDTNNVDRPLRTKEYVLTKINGAGVSGRVLFKENRGNSFNVEITLDSSVKDTVHIVHIHNGNIESPGSLALLLNDIRGTGNVATSITDNISTRLATDGSRRPLNYDSLLTYNGYVDVHFSAAKSDSVMSQGNIGRN